MDGTTRWLIRKCLPPRRRLLGLCLAGLPLIGVACAQMATEVVPSQPQATVRAVKPDAPAAIVRTSASEGSQMPAPAQSTGIETAPEPRGVTQVPPPALPISLDTVFRLAEDQNQQIRLVREKVNEAYAEKKVADKRWVPDLYVGPAYYRHEGGIQAFQGFLIRSSTGAMFTGMELNSNFNIREFAFQKVNAERQVWQQKGELSKITNETLLDAASTYIDLMTARSGEVLSRETEIQITALLRDAEKLARQEPGSKIEVHRIEAELRGQQQLLLKVREQASAASSKLAYLLGVPPCTEMIPVDPALMPVELVDASPPVCDLVSTALTYGPGVQEMEGLLGLIQESMDRARGPASWLPTIGVRMAEGGFGAAPGDALTWDNRWDFGLQARWNLSEFVTARDRRKAVMAKMHQANLAYEDLKGKLTVGVQESRGAILSGREQIGLSEKQVEEAQRAYDLSNRRRKENVPGSSYSEVLLAVRSLAFAKLNYLIVVAAYDKAHIRLMLLLGPTAGCQSTPDADTMRDTGGTSPSDLPPLVPHEPGTHANPAPNRGRPPAGP